MKLCMGCMQEIEDIVTTCPYCGYDETRLQQEAYYLRPGTIIAGKYIVGRVLKYGGYVIKYIGLDAEKNCKVTISEYLPSDFSTRSEGETEVTIYSGDALEQFNQGLITFLNEGSQIQQLGAVKGIAQIYDCIAENETGYYISEYLEGESLWQLLDKGKRFAPAAAGALVSEILQGLHKIHSLGIVHCDIAPENIFITKEGEAKLTDFGAAKYVTTANSKSLAIILKQGYAPEEQYRSRGERGPWTDVYAMAAVLYHMITGKVPEESVDRTLEDNLEPPSGVVPDMPKAMENALLNALNVYKKDRTPSAAEFYKELNSPDTKRRKVKQKKRETGRMPVWVKGLVAVVACMVIAGGAVLFKAHQQEEQLKIAGKVDEKFDTGINKSYKAFQKSWEGYGFDQSCIEVEYRYDTSVSEDTVKEFEDYTDTGCLVDGAAMKSIKKDTAVKNGEVFAKIIVASADKYTFLQSWTENAPMVVADGEETTYEQKKFCGVIESSGDVSQPYGMVKSITVDGKEMRAEDLSEPLYAKDSNGHKKNQVVISIYAGSYYVMKANSAHDKDYYRGKQISQIKFQYGKNKDWKMQSLDSAKYEKNYISFEESEGTIVEVESNSLAQGRKYDGSREVGGMLFDTVGVHFTYGVTTVEQLKKQQCRIKNSGKYRNDDLVIWTAKKTFKRNEEIAIKTMAKPTPTPKATPKPVVTQKPVEIHKSKPTQKASERSDDFNWDNTAGKEEK